MCDKPQISVQILVILFLVSTLVFLSSFISLTHHEIHHPTEHHFTNSREHQLQKSRQQLKPSSELSPTVPPIIPSTQSSPKVEKGKDKTEKSNPKSNGGKKPKPTKNGNNKETPHYQPSQRGPMLVDYHRNRTKANDLRFPSKCHINPHIHYWNEYTEENISPLRYYHGLRAPSHEQKFIVFQPDPGGWNNIRMALEVVILLAKVTGRILVMPPNAVLYLLSLNKKWGENKSSMEDYFDFTKLRARYGLETMTMETFLETIALKEGYLQLPLPNHNIHLIRKELWSYLEQACYVQPWSPGKLFFGLHIPTISSSQYETLNQSTIQTSTEAEQTYVHSFDTTVVDNVWQEEFSLQHQRSLLPYDTIMHSHRAIYFPGHEANRLLTHYYSYLFFPTKSLDHEAKRFMRDRLRYHDEIFCLGSTLIERLLLLQDLVISQRGKKLHQGLQSPMYKEWPTLSYTTLQELALKHIPEYVAFHIRRGDFQQKHTRLAAEEIIRLTAELVPDRHRRIAYIATDERNRSFFQPFFETYEAVYFLDDIAEHSGIENVNQNFVGMIEQVICAAAHTFIGTPLSTFTAYITRMRGYLNRTLELPLTDDPNNPEVFYLSKAGIYDRTYYFMKHQMYQLHTKPHVHFPLWVRDFVDVFQDIDEEIMS